MSVTDIPKKAATPEDTEQMKKLKEKADRFTVQRAFETVRERHGLQKAKSPK